MMSMQTNTDQQQTLKSTCVQNMLTKLNLLEQKQFQIPNGIFTESLLMMMVKQQSISMPAIQAIKML